MPKLTPIARAACALTLLGLGACEQAPIATLPTNDLRASEQVFAIFCRRLARESAPHDPDGLAFRPACEEGNGDALPSLASTGGLRALVARRPQILAALDRALGTGTSADALTAFAKADVPVPSAHGVCEGRRRRG